MATPTNIAETSFQDDVDYFAGIRRAPPPRLPSPGRFIKLRSQEHIDQIVSHDRQDSVELNYVVQLLSQIDDQDSKLSDVLQSRSREEISQEEEENTEERGHKLPSSAVTYQDFMNAFISLLLQFLDSIGEVKRHQDPHNIIHSLMASRQCPDVRLFKRVEIDPTLVASCLPENENSHVHKNIPVNQLARFCDIAVLKFLSTVTEHTSIRAVTWALDYLQNLLNSLISSLNSLHSFGWYGAPSMRIKKGTTLSLPIPSGPLPNFPGPPPLPPVVVVRSPPRSPSRSPSRSSSRSPEHFSLATTSRSAVPSSGTHTASNLDLILPETGQRSPISSPQLPHLQLQQQQPVVSGKATPQNPGNSDSFLGAHHAYSSPLMAGAATKGSQRFGSEMGRGQGDKQRRNSREERAMLLTIRSANSPRAESPERSPSPSRRHSGGSSPGSASNRKLSPTISSPSLSLSPPRGSFEQDLHPLPPPPPPGGASRFSISETKPPLGSIQEEDEEMHPLNLERSSPVVISRDWSPSPDFSSLPEGEEEEDEKVRSKPTSTPTTDAPNFDEQRELDTLMNGEGRISLIAILHAITNLPQTQDLWTEDICLKCFSLIQLCMNLGLIQADEPSEANSAQDRRKRFQKHENLAFQKHGAEKPFKAHSKCIVQYSTNALIHCSTNMIIGCTNDNGFCKLTYKHLPSQSRTIYDKLIRNLRRLHLHSSAHFRQALTQFAATASCRKLFHFLHVVLQYCLQGREHMRLDSLMVAIVASVLRNAVDRLVELDVREGAIQKSIITEACCFFQYAQTVFGQDSLMKTQSFNHLHMYIHRIALSVILPPRPPPPEPPVQNDPVVSEIECASPPPVSIPPAKKLDTLPHKKLKSAVTFDVSSRVRSESLPLTASTGVVTTGKAPQKQSKARRSHLSKQQSIHNDPDGPEGSVPKLNVPGMEWRGLRLDLLRDRVQRLVVLMETTEPGTVPDAGMLASLIDLNDGTSVVARAMVFLECAIFVSNLRTKKRPTQWVTHNRDNCVNVSSHLQRWGEAIGEKLRLIELQERMMIGRIQALSQTTGGSIILPEEPVFPEDNRASTNFETRKGAEFVAEVGQTVSYALKMAACILLLEITRFLRDPPPQFTNTGSISQMSTPRVSVVHLDRKTSTASNISSDFESVHTLHPGDFRPMLGRQHSDFHIQHGSNLSVDESEISNVKSHSVEETSPTTPRRKRVSVYLHVNSRIGAGVKRSSSVRRQTVVRYVDSPVEEQSAQPYSAGLYGRRQSLSTGLDRDGSIHGSIHRSGGGGDTGISKATRRPTLGSGVPRSTVGTHHPPRRKSASALLSNAASISESEMRPPLVSQASNASNKVGLGTLLRRSAQRAFRRKIVKHRPAPGSGTNSPNLTQRKRLQQQRQSQMGSVLCLPEDSRRQNPWLDIVEHLTLVNAFDPEAHKWHKKACLELITVLNTVYTSATPENDTADETDNKFLSIPRSLSTIFAAGPLLSMNDMQEQSEPSTTIPYSRQSVPVYLSGLKRHSDAIRSTSVPAGRLPGHEPGIGSANPLATLRFTKPDYEKSTSSFLVATSPNQEECIELFLEEESAYTRTRISEESDTQRRKYLKTDFCGLMHAPFSLLVHAAPILHDTTFSNLKEVAWDTLLDTDHELAKAAGAFFLLACAKENVDTVKKFVSEQVIKAGAVKQREAVQRFMVLWQTRYHVWPRMEERAQKKFHMYSENDKEDSQEQQSIGYSLPANLLGSAGATIPLAPWEPVSVCTNRTCKENPDKCFQPTQLAPIIHPDDISKKVDTHSVSGVSVPQEASSKPTSVYHGVGSTDSTGNINEIQWEAVEPTLFPRSLLPLIHFIITSLNLPSSSSKVSPPSSSFSSSFPSNTAQDSYISEIARQAVWVCMVEDPRLFFSPLLNQFNQLHKTISSKKSKNADHQVDSLLAEILFPLHVVLQVFPMLPPSAAHFLFNNFVGIIMWHTDQPCTHSAKITQSVLTLTGMVVPSVQGLDSKVLKSILKKESCYTTIMTTARIRGVEKVYVVPEHAPQDKKSYEVGDGMTFGQLIADDRDKNLSVELLQNWYLVDESKGLPLLSSLVVQDHYSVSADGQYPTFVLKQAGQLEKPWNTQLEQLFVYKMSEVMRVSFTTQLLQTGPEVEKGFAYSEFAQPNYRFVHMELVELNSFPRKALTSILYEAGPTALQHAHLRASDIMLKGMWARFVLQLFRSTKPDYNWSNSMILFLNVVNGALLLHSEDHTILRFCLASLLTAASKFSSIFKRDGYQMIVPTLVQVYALHMHNKLVTNALKFTWCQLYILDSNFFLLQAIAATAILLSEEASILSSNVSSTYAGFPQSTQTMEGEVAQRHHAKAVFELLEALDEELPPDELEILVGDQDGRTLSSENRQRFSLQNTFSLCVTLATWNPEALRGMQVLVFLDHLMPLFLNAFASHTSPTFLPNSMKYLIKGCEVINKTQIWKGDVYTARKGRGKGSDPVLGGPLTKTLLPEDSGGDLHTTGGSKPVSRRSSSVSFQQVRKLINPKKKEFSSKKQASLNYSRTKRVQAPTTALAPIDHKAYVGGFGLRRIQDLNQRVLKLSRESLLSLSSQFVLHAAGELQTRTGGGRRESSSRVERSKTLLDNQAVLILATVAVQLFKQGEKNSETILQGKGLNSYMSVLLPTLDWSEPSSFSILIVRINKLFKKLRDDPNKALLVWENLATFITGITHCIQKNPHLVVGQDQLLSKLKLLLELIVGITSEHGQKALHRHFLHNAPASFSDAVVRLAAELIVATRHCSNPKLRYGISDLLSQRLTLTKLPKDIILNKILLPLCIQLGLRDEEGCPSEADVDYMLQFVYKDIENVLKLAGNTRHSCQVQPVELFFRELKVVCCAFAEVFTLCKWHQVAQWVLSLSQRKFANPLAKKISTVSMDQGSASHQPRHSGTPGAALLENFIAFHNSLLSFFESFLLVYRVPLFSLLWPLLGQMESQLTTTLQDIKTDIPALCDKIHRCIDRYRSLQVRGAANAPSYKSRNILLRELQEELKHLSSTSQSLGRSHTTLERKRSHTRPRPPRRGSTSLSNISEVHEDVEALISPSSSKSRRDATDGAHRKKLETRPTFLKLASTPPSSGEQKPKDPIGKKSKVSQSPSPHKQRPHPPLKRTLKKRSTLHPFPPADSPSESPVLPKKRAPPLAQLRAMSSECHADIEDFDTVSPDATPRHSISAPSPTEDTKHLVATNTTTSIQGRELGEQPRQLTVLAEVHEPPTQPRQNPSMTETQPPSKGAIDSVSCSSGDGMDTLLLSVRDPVISTQSSFSQNEYERLSDTDELLQQKSSVSRKTSRNTASPMQPRKKSLSLDRKQLAAGFRELGASIKAESTPIKYICLNVTEDDTEC